MSNLSPLVSIVIPVYNGSNYLSEAIESALNQTYPNCEVIVVNDGSLDSGLSRDIALTYGDKIRYFEKENGGVSSALNFGIKKMEGEYFSWLSHDDVYNSEKIESQIKFMFKNKCESSVVFSDYYVINHDDKYVGRSNLFLFNFMSVRLWLTIFSELHGCSLLIPSKYLKNQFLFNENIKYGQDYDLWLRLSYECDFMYYPKYLLYSRKHDTQDSHLYSDIVFKESKFIRNNFFNSLRLEDFSYAKNPKIIYILVRNLISKNGVFGFSFFLIFICRTLKNRFSTLKFNKEIFFK